MQLDERLPELALPPVKLLPVAGEGFFLNGIL